MEEEIFWILAFFFGENKAIVLVYLPVDFVVVIVINSFFFFFQKKT